MTPSDVDYVNAHGTSTAARVTSPRPVAIRAVFGDAPAGGQFDQGRHRAPARRVRRGRGSGDGAVGRPRHPAADAQPGRPRPGLRPGPRARRGPRPGRCAWRCPTRSPSAATTSRCCSPTARRRPSNEVDTCTVSRDRSRRVLRGGRRRRWRRDCAPATASASTAAPTRPTTARVLLRQRDIQLVHHRPVSRPPGHASSSTAHGDGPADDRTGHPRPGRRAARGGRGAARCRCCRRRAAPARPVHGVRRRDTHVRPPGRAGRRGSNRCRGRSRPTTCWTCWTTSRSACRRANWSRPSRSTARRWASGRSSRSTSRSATRP